MVSDYERIETVSGYTVFYKWPKGRGKGCIVFVHGLCGDAVTYWGKLPAWISGTRFARDKDVISYGYESSRFISRFGKQIGIEDLVEDLVTFLDVSVKGYRRVYIVTHSLGAILVTGAIATLSERDSRWRKRVRGIIHLAPALWGNELIDRPLLPVQVEGKTIRVRNIAFLSKVSQALRRSSKLLGRIRESWKAYIRVGKTRAVAIWGSKDGIVVQDWKEASEMAIESLSVSAGHTDIKDVNSLNDPVYQALLVYLYQYDGRTNG